jgi:hypothetical protein
MRFSIIGAVLISALPLAPAFAETAPPPASPNIIETQDAKIRAEYLEALPYKPCPANVRLPNGQQVCLGLPRYPDSRVRSYDPSE